MKLRLVKFNVRRYRGAGEYASFDVHGPDGYLGIAEGWTKCVKEDLANLSAEEFMKLYNVRDPA